MTDRAFHSFDEEQSKVVREATEANLFWLKPRVVTLADTKRDYSDAKDLSRWKFGSGTLVTIGGHYLIATAGHVIPEKPIGRLWLITHQMTIVKDALPDFPSFGKHPDLDVGFVEIHPEAISKCFPNNEMVTLDNVAPRTVGRPAGSVLLVGSPGEHVQCSMSGVREMTIVPKGMPFRTIPLQPADWPSLDVPRDGRPFDPTVDILLDYPETDRVRVDGGPLLPLPNPEGMSGGGIWDQQLVAEEVWSPNALKLIGIQSEWWEKGRYLRAVQVLHWLRLIYARFPDLRDELLAVFGEDVRFKG
jgi:hypothetical protein